MDGSRERRLAAYARGEEYRFGPEEIVPFDDPEDLPRWLIRALRSNTHSGLDPFNLRVKDYMALRKIWKDVPEMNRFERSLIGVAEGTQHFKDDLEWLIKEAPGEFVDYVREKMSRRSFMPREEKERLREMEAEE